MPKPSIRQLKRPLLIVLVAMFAVTVLRRPLARIGWAVLWWLHGGHTVSDRLEQYGDAVRQRLAPAFEAAEMKYPPGRVILVGLKKEKELQLWSCGRAGQFKLIKTYPILAASGRLGPKLREGDCQVPEGLYRIESLNPDSMFHLSLRINYPNAFDQAQAKRDGRSDLGGDIMIHGMSASIGCLAMGDAAAEELFVLAAETGLSNIEVILSPVDFRLEREAQVEYTLPGFTEQLHEQIKARLLELPYQAESSLAVR